MQVLFEALLNTNGLELAAVILAISYLLLAIRQNILCWAAALLSSGLYCFIFFSVELYFESVLQVFYVAMAVYGWISWRGDSYKEGKGLEVSSLSLQTNLILIFTIVLLTIISASVLNKDSTLDYLDAFTTWGAIIATFMVTKKILENWIYWLIIDSVAIFLYFEKELYLTAALFAAYILIALMGYIAWYHDYKLKGANESKFF